MSQKSSSDPVSTKSSENLPQHSGPLRSLSAADLQRIGSIQEQVLLGGLMGTFKIGLPEALKFLEMVRVKTLQSLPPEYLPKPSHRSSNSLFMPPLNTPDLLGGN